MEENKSKSNLDIFLWILISVLIASGIVANLYFGELAWSIRFAIGIVLLIISFGLFYLTAQGKRFWSFLKSAKMELYKVVWPSRDETIKTTAIVAVLVFAMSLILWALDTFLLWVVSWFTG